MAPRKQDVERLERDYELFLRDVEEDQELRQGVNLYKHNRPQGDDVDMESEMDEDEEEGPQIPMEELLDDFDEMTIQDG